MSEANELDLRGPFFNMSRFDYVKYDETSVNRQDAVKSAAIELEKAIESVDLPIADKTKALNHLEICYMWVGKGIRNNQISRNGSAELQEQRTNS